MCSVKIRYTEASNYVCHYPNYESYHSYSGTMVSLLADDGVLEALDLHENLYQALS